MLIQAKQKSEEEAKAAAQQQQQQPAAQAPSQPQAQADTQEALAEVGSLRLQTALIMLLPVAHTFEQL